VSDYHTKKTFREIQHEACQTSRWRRTVKLKVWLLYPSKTYPCADWIGDHMGPRAVVEQREKSMPLLEAEPYSSQSHEWCVSSVSYEDSDN
jgi:hypothetical protein